MSATATNQRPVITLLSLSIFFSSIGTSLLLVDTSVSYLEGSGSPTLATLVYVAQYLPMVLLASAAAWLCDRFAPRRLLITVELVTMMVSVGIGVVSSVHIVVFVLLFCRGFLDVVMKSSRGVAAKMYLDATHLERGNNTMSGGYYFGSGAGGLLGVALIGQLTIFEISLVNAGTFVIAAALYAGLASRRAPKSSFARGGAWRRTMAATARDARLGREFAYLVLSVSFLEGVNPILRVWMPVKWLGLGANAAALTQTIGLVGVAAGLAASTLWLSGARRETIHPGALMTVSATASLGIVASRVPAAAFVAYFGYFAVYEALYTRCLNGILIFADATEVPYVMAAFYGAGYGGMIVVILSTSVITGQFGLPPMLAGLAVASCVGCVLVEVLLRRRRGREQQCEKHSSETSSATDGRQEISCYDRDAG